jgi:hypothetical protein
MPRIIVTTDPPQLPGGAPVLLDEQVQSVHLSSGHAAAQLVERLAWAISDAEEAEGATDARSDHRPQRLGHSHGRRRAARARPGLPIGG